MYNWDMSKAVLLLHGFKRNNKDDFEEVMPFIETLGFDKIYNEVWFDNYDKSTLDYKCSLKRVEEIVELINNSNHEEVTIIAYSTGSLIGALISEKLTTRKVNYYSITPPYKIYFWRYISLAIKLLKMDKKLKKRFGEERYNRLKEKQIENKTIEQYPISIIVFISHQIIRRYKNSLKKIENGKFLLSSTDDKVVVKVTNKVVSKNKTNKITMKEFNHDNILRGEKDIFIEWIKDNIKK